MILGSLYENREDETSTTVNELPKGALWLLDPYRLDLGV
ncbi:MAG: head-tail connector protein [Acinetobacter sp.]